MRKLLFLVSMLCICGALQAQISYIDQLFGSDGWSLAAQLSGPHNCTAMTMQEDGKIVLAGVRQSAANAPYSLALARFLSNGKIDSTFGTNGWTYTNPGTDHHYAYSVIIADEGKIVVGGYQKLGTAYPNFALFGFLNNGAPDPGFGTNGIALTDFGAESECRSLIWLPEGKILAGGLAKVGNSAYTKDYALARFLPDGTPDSSFTNGGKLAFNIFPNSDNYIDDLLVQPDGKIVATGYAIQQGYYKELVVFRRNSDGSAGSEFYHSSGTSIIRNTGTELALLPDGKILAAGYSADSSPNVSWLLARLNQNGTADTTFGTSGQARFTINNNFSSVPTDLNLQIDGKIVVSGKLSSTGGWNFHIRRFSENGAEDNTFGNAGKLSIDFQNTTDHCNNFKILPDGKYLLAGTANDKFALLRLYSEQVSTSANLAAQATAIHLFPNPSAGKFTVETPVPGQLRVYDLNGMLQFSTAISAEITLVQQPFVPGNYLWHFEARDGGIQNGKLVVIGE